MEMMLNKAKCARTTLAVTLAASLRWAPIKLATRVDVAIASGKGMLKEVDVTVTRMLWAASWAVPNWEAEIVNTSKTENWASIMTIPGNASLIIGPGGLGYNC